MSRVALSAWLSDLESGARPKGGIKDGVGEIPSLGAEHLADDGGFNFSKDKRIPRDFFQSMTKGRIRRNDILIVKDGATTGKVSFVGDDFPYEDAAVNEHVFIVRVSNRLADPKFVFRYLQTPQGQSEIMSDFRGATVGGIGRTFVEKVTLPKVVVDEQRRIAAILDKADAIRRKREQALTLADDFLRSVFLEMFGDPTKIGNHEPTLSEVATISRGRFSPRPRNDPRYYNGDFPFIQTGEIANSISYLSEYRQTLNEAGTKVSKSFPAGTVFVAIVGATIGATTVSTRRFWCPDSVIGIVPKSQAVPAEFIEFLLRFWRPVFVATAPSTARANINLQTLNVVRIPKADTDAPARFAEIFKRTYAFKQKLEQMDSGLLPALSQRAFASDL